MLKAAQKELQKGNVDAALVSVENYLEDNPDNYNALLLQAKCYQSTEPQKALAACQRAAEIEPDKVWAWKGMIMACVALKDCAKLLDACIGQVLALEAQDAADNRPAALDAFQKTQRFIERTGYPADKLRLLKTQLPGSPIYDYLGPVLNPPMVTLNAMLTEERYAFKTAQSKLKSRARNNVSFNSSKSAKESLKLFESSEIPSLLQQVIDIVDDDEARRLAEIELLDFKYQQLYLSPQKEELAQQVHQLADDMVLFSPPSPLPYLVHWDWLDCASYAELELETIQTFIDLFPQHGLARILNAFLHSSINPFSTTDQDEKLWPHQEIMDAINIGYDEAASCILANRIIADIFIQSEDWENATQFAKEGLRLVDALKLSTSRPLPVTKSQLSLQLGTAYIYYQAPKNFPLAEKLFDTVLKASRENEQALIGKALLLAQSHKLRESLAQFEQLAVRFPNNFTVLSELAWAKIRVGEFAEAQDAIHKCLKLALDQGSAQQIADRRALLYWRLGYSYWIEQKPAEAFHEFVNALQQNPSYAPAYSYLGLFYQQQGDASRSTRCFYKALEIDSGEMIAANCLVSKFAQESQWDIVEIITTRLLESEKLVDPVTGQQVEWPFRVMGIACVARHDYPEAVKYFQKCLRLVPEDANSWVGLGEAYIHSGRYRSAEKALKRALEIEPENLSALYELSLAHRETLDFNAAAAAIQRALDLSGLPEFRTALVDNYVKAAQSYLEGSLLGDAYDTAALGLESGIQDLRANCEHGGMWSSVASCVDIFLQVQGHQSKLPVELIAELRALLGLEEDEASLGVLLVRSLDKAQEFAGASRGSKAAAAFNLGVGHYKLYSLFGGSRANLDAAVHNLKRALTFETRNHEYWNVYGVVVQALNPRIAQHCFVRSIKLFNRSPATWANLGLLYLQVGDTELASEAFDRALSVDPDSTSAWLGQALGDYVLGRSTEQVLRLVEHSYLIASGKDRVARLLFGLFSAQASRATGRVGHNGVGALEQLLRLTPSDRRAIVSYAQLLERAGDYDESLRKLLPAAETAAQHSQVARLYLGLHNWSKAVEHAHLALELDQGDERVQLGAVLVLGLAQYFDSRFDEALETFGTALELSDSQDVVVLLAQVLWETGRQEERDLAAQQLFESIENQGTSVKVSLVLGVIGLLNEDQDVIDAVSEELQGTSLMEESADVAYVLSRLQRSPAALRRALFVNPTDYDIWKHIDREMALQVARANGDCTKLHEAFIGAEGLVNAQRAVMFSPASTEAWTNLAQEAHKAQAQEAHKLTA